MSYIIIAGILGYFFYEVYNLWFKGEATKPVVKKATKKKATKKRTPKKGGK